MRRFLPLAILTAALAAGTISTAHASDTPASRANGTSGVAFDATQGFVANAAADLVLAHHRSYRSPRYRSRGYYGHRRGYRASPYYRYRSYGYRSYYPRGRHYGYRGGYRYRGRGFRH